MKPSSATDGEKIAVRRQLLADSIHVIRCLVDQCDECHAIAQRYAPDGVYATLEWVTTESSTLIEDAPCETCNDDPAVCATVPGLRHCEAAMRETRVSEIAGSGEVDFLRRIRELLAPLDQRTPRVIEALDAIGDRLIDLGTSRSATLGSPINAAPQGVAEVKARCDINAQHPAVAAPLSQSDKQCGIAKDDYGREYVTNIHDAAARIRQLEVHLAREKECWEASERRAIKAEASLSARVEQDYRSHWLMRHADGKEWETSCEYTLAEISGVEWKAKPVRRIEKPSSDIPQGSA